jgi:hypothetical protein
VVAVSFALGPVGVGADSDQIRAVAKVVGVRLP